MNYLIPSICTNSVSVFCSGEPLCILDGGLLLRSLTDKLTPFIEHIGECEVNHIIVNLLLIINDGRRGFLLETYHEGLRENPDARTELLGVVHDIVTENRLNMAGDVVNGYVISKFEINVDKINDAEYMARMLDFGCVDPRYDDRYVPRLAYHFSAVRGEDVYYIMTFVCRIGFIVSNEQLTAMVNRIQAGLDKTGSSWHVQYEIESVPRERRRCVIS